MKVKMKKQSITYQGAFHVGQVCDVSDSLGEHLVEIGNAEPVVEKVQTKKTSAKKKGAEKND